MGGRRESKGKWKQERAVEWDRRASDRPHPGTLWWHPESQSPRAPYVRTSPFSPASVLELTDPKNPHLHQEPRDGSPSGVLTPPLAAPDRAGSTAALGPLV